MGLMRRLAAFLDGKPEWPPVLQKDWPSYGTGSSLSLEEGV